MKIHHCSWPSLSLSFLVINLSTPKNIISFKVEILMESSPRMPHWLLHDIWNWTSGLYQLLPKRLSSLKVFANSCFGLKCHTRQIPCSLWTGTFYSPSFLGGFSSLPFSILPPTSFNDISSLCNHRAQEASARNHCLLMNQTPLQHSCVWSQLPMMERKAGAWDRCAPWWDCVAHNALQPRWFQTPPESLSQR